MRIKMRLVAFLVVMMMVLPGGIAAGQEAAELSPPASEEGVASPRSEAEPTPVWTEADVERIRPQAAQPAETEGASGATAAESPSVETMAGQEPKSGSLSTLSTNSLTLEVTDLFGTATDRVIPADGASHSLTVKLLDNGVAVSGAEVLLDGTSQGSTGTDGTFSLTISTTTSSRRFMLTARLSDGRSVSTALYSLPSGLGAVELAAVDAQGRPFSDFDHDLALYVTSYWQAIRWSSGIISSGTWSALFNGRDADGAGYHIPLGSVAVPSQSLVTVSVNPTSLNVVRRTIHVMDGTMNVSNASVGIVDDQLVPSWGPRVYTNTLGEAFFYTLPNAATYTITAAGGTPRVLGEVSGADLSTTYHLDFSTGRAMDLIVDLGSLTSTGTFINMWTERRTNASLSAFDVAGTYKVLPGKYRLRPAVIVPESSDYWYYTFTPYGDPHGPGWITVTSTDAKRTLRLGGTLTPQVDGPTLLSTSSNTYYVFSPKNDTAALTDIYLSSSSGSGSRRPLIELVDGAGVTRQSGSSWYSVGLKAPEPGAYTVRGTLAPAGPYIPATMTATLSVATSTPLTVSITENHGGLANDGAVPADGVARSITVSVKDGTTAVSGATLYLDGASVATTDANGSATVALPARTEVKTSLLEAKTSAGAGSVLVDFLTDGWSVVRRGTTTGAALTQSVLNLYSSKEIKAVSPKRYFQPGTYQPVLTGKDGDGNNYLVRLPEVAIPNQAAITVSPDLTALTLQSVRFQVINGTATPVAGAEVVLADQSLPRLWSDARSATDSTGYATYKVNAGSADRYTLLAAGGAPKVIGAFTNLDLSSVTDVLLDFAGGPLLTVSAAAPPTGLTLSGTDLVVKVGDTWLSAYIAGAEGTFTVHPGSYRLSGVVKVPYNGETWHYHFEPTNLSTPFWAPVSFAGGDAERTFLMGGEQTGLLEGGSFAGVGSHTFQKFVPRGLTSALRWVERRDSAGNFYAEFPSFVARDPAGAVWARSSGKGWDLGWQPRLAGTYFVTASHPGGPYYPAGIHASPFRVSVDEWFSAITDRPWIAARTTEALTATLTLGGKPVPGAVIELPRGSMAGGSPASSVTTDKNGQASFTVNAPHGGSYRLPVRLWGVQVAGLNLSVLGDGWGTLRFTSPEGAERKVHPILFRQREDGTLEDAWCFATPSSCLLQAGTYTATISDSGQIWTLENIRVDSDQSTAVVLDPAQLSEISVQATMTRSGQPITSGWVYLVNPALGPRTMVWAGYPSNGKIRVTPGTYDLLFIYSDDTADYDVAERGVSAGSTVTKSYRAEDLAFVLPTAVTEAGQYTNMTLGFRVGGSERMGHWLAYGQGLFLPPVSAALDHYSLMMDIDGQNYRYFFTADRSSTLVAGSNGSVWQDLGGPLTASLVLSPTGAIYAGTPATVDFRLQNAAGDRLRSICCFAEPPATLSLRDGLGLEVYRQPIGLAAEQKIHLPEDLPAGTYSASVALNETAGMLYGNRTYAAAGQIVVGTSVTARVYPRSAGHNVVPGGGLGVLLDVNDALSGADVGLAYDPAKVSYQSLICKDSATGAAVACDAVTVDSATSGVVRVTWTASSTTDLMPQIHLIFTVAADAAGEALFGITSDSTVQKGGQTLTSGVQFRGGGVAVASSALLGQITVDPGQDPWRSPVVLVNNGGLLGWGSGFDAAAGTTPSDYVLEDVPQGSLTLIAAGPGYLAATATATVGSTPLTTGPSLSVKTGDWNGDGAIDRKDLDLLAGHLGREWVRDPVAWMVNPASEKPVGLSDLARAARNVGATGPVPGAATLTVVIPPDGHLPALGVNGLVVLTQQGAAVAARPARLYPGVHTVTRFENLPPGPYRVSVLIGLDRPAAYDRQAHLLLLAGSQQTVTLGGYRQPYTATPRYGGTIYLPLWTATDGLNPLTTNYESTIQVLDTIFEGLADLSKQMLPVPALAESWQWDATGTQLTVRLRKGVTFHDGTPLTANDVIFSHKASMHPKYAGAWKLTHQVIQGYQEYANGQVGETDFTTGIVTSTPIAGLYAPDPQTVVFRLTRAHAPFLADVLTMPVLSEKQYGSVPVQDWGTTADPNRYTPNGTGPFRLVEHLEGQYTHVAANPNYWAGRPLADGINWRVLDPANALSQLTGQTLDLVQFGPVDYGLYRDLAEGGGAVITEASTTIYQEMIFNTQRAPFNDRRVRQAMAFAMNRAYVIQDSTLMAGHATPVYTPMSPGSWAFTTDVEQYNQNLLKATQLLDEAGWAVGSDGIRVKNGVRLSVELLYPNAGNQVRINTAPLVQQWLKEIGVEVTLTGLDWTTLLQRTFTDFNFDFFLIGFSTGADPDPTGVWDKSAYVPDGFNASGWWTDYSESLIHQGQTTTDPEKRAEIYKAWQQHWAYEAPAYMFYSSHNLYASLHRLQGLQFGPLGPWHAPELLWLAW